MASSTESKTDTPTSLKKYRIRRRYDHLSKSCNKSSVDDLDLLLVTQTQNTIKK